MKPLDTVAVKWFPLTVFFPFHFNALLTLQCPRCHIQSQSDEKVQDSSNPTTLLNSQQGTPYSDLSWRKNNQVLSSQQNMNTAL